MITLEKLLKTAGKVSFLGDDLLVKYKGHYIIIGNLKENIFCSIKTEENMRGRRAVNEYELDKFNVASDFYNSYGWLKTDLPFWKTRKRFIKLILTNGTFRNLIAAFLTEMQEIVDKFLPIKSDNKDMQNKK